MGQTRIRASFMRGGTSKAVVFRQGDLPTDRREWDSIFLRVMGSPDPNGRQLDGMGGGISSLSKVCVVGPSTRDDADIDYTFAQISVRDASVDYSGNCGNMSSAIGPFAVEEGFVPAPADGEAVVRIHNTNTSKIIVSRFNMEDGAAAVDGDLVIDGIAGTGAPIRLEFTDPGGAKTGRLLPTGSPRDILDVPGLGRITASLVDAANPCVFVDAADLGMRGDERPDALEADTVFLERMEAIRRLASVHMGIARDPDEAGRVPSVPKVAIVASPRAMSTLSGRALQPSDMTIAIRMISIGQPHRAVPITGALCLAVAIRIPGSVPHTLALENDGPIRIAHPSGVTVVDAKVQGPEHPNGLHAEYGAVYRTARRLFDGTVFCRAER
jgi:2-methylaconitate cis-trans-isomerase PrpF